MMMRATIVLFSFGCLGCESMPRDGASGTAPAHAPESSAGAPSAAPEWRAQGVLVPAESLPISLWPEAHTGELVLTKVAAHGTRVERGEVVLEFESRGIDAELRDQRLELASAELRHRGAVERARIDDEAAAAARAQATAALERVRRDLEGHEAHAVMLRERQQKLQQDAMRNGIEDQVDELAQLTAMYEADELTDATEEIVIKRSQRDLAMTRARQSLMGDQWTFQQDYPHAAELAVKRDSVRDQEAALSRLMRSQELDRRAREDGVTRSQAALEVQREKVAKLERDRALFEVRAPESGVFLHGSPDAYADKLPRPDHERGNRVPTRTIAFALADPSSAELVVAIPESKLARFANGSRVTIVPIATAETRLEGVLEIDAYPTPKSAAEPENAYRARVRLDSILGALPFGSRARIEP